MSKELKPCPKCNHSLVIMACNSNTKWWVECCEFREKNCDFQSETYDTAIELFTAWNTRPSPWLKITPETMPKTNTDVLMNHDGLLDRGYMDTTGQWWLHGNKLRPPDHYMPIPPIPEEN